MKKWIDLQLFAEDGASPSAEPAAEPNAQPKAEPTPAPAATVKDSGEKRYSDADVNRIIDQKFAEWQKKQDKAVDEAKRLSEMNAQQKAEYERDKLKKELDELKRQASIAEMSKTARKMLSDSGITIPDELLGMMVTPNAEDTKAAVDSFAKVFTEAVEAAVKERLKGEPPRRGSGAPSMTKEQIAAIKDPELRQKAMLEHKHLYNF